MTQLAALWGKAKLYALVAAGAIAAVMVAYWRIREDGKNAVALEQERARIRAIADRKESDDEINQMGAADVDRDLDKWLRDRDR